MASISVFTPVIGCTDCIAKSPSNQEFNSNTAQPVDQIPLCPELGLIDDEGLFVLPPEDADEASNDELENEKSSCASIKHSIANSLDRVSDTSSIRSFTTSQKHKKRKKRAYTVNLSNCKYESVRRVLRRFGFREVEEDEDWNLYWTDYSVSLDRVVVMKAWQKINHFPGMSELCRKDSLARNLNRMAKMFPKDYAIFPKTWCLPSDWNELQNYARKRKSKTYIFKPDTGCQGRGIYLTKSVKDMRPMDNMICQVYLSKPFVIDGYKFDLRLYILLTSCDPLRMFMFKDGLVRFTTVQYADPNNRNVNNLYMHLTNYALQKHSNEYIRDDEEGGTKRRVTTLNRWFRENDYDLQKIWADIDDVIIKTVLSGYAVLRHNYRTCFPNHVQTSACFEILGFDIMLDHKLKPYILEVNHSPSFSTDSKLDKEIKEAMLWDTLQLAHFSMISKKKCMEDERKRIRSRLLQKTVRKDVRETNEKDLAHFNEVAEKYERNHLGNYRMIYPPADKEKYEKFLNPHAMFYQETVTYKVRSECARQMREEIKMKQEKLDALQHKGKPIGPESPAPKKLASRSMTVRSKSQTVSGAERRLLHPNPLHEAQRPWGDQEFASDLVTETVNLAQAGDARASWEAQPIVAEEEESRLEALRQRERLMHAVGLVEAIHRLLAGSSGVISTIGASVRAKMPRNMGEMHRQCQKPISSNVSLDKTQTKTIVMSVHPGFNAAVSTVKR
ncbi:unnamed protein product [Dicrocoelium dendriticum]|nr:unnamed protein product [Dicrocoelium dendriticum]